MKLQEKLKETLDEVQRDLEKYNQQTLRAFDESDIKLLNEASLMSEYLNNMKGTIELIEGFIKQLKERDLQLQELDSIQTERIDMAAYDDDVLLHLRALIKKHQILINDVLIKLET